MADNGPIDRPKDAKGRFIQSNFAKKSKRFYFLNKVNMDPLKDHSYAALPQAFNTVDYDETDIGRNVTVNDDNSNITWTDGRRIVDLHHLSEQLICLKCGYLLHLKNILTEQRRGLASFLHIRCESCNYINNVTTDKRNENGGFVINSKVSVAMVHAGMGPTHVTNFMAACEIPPPVETTLRRKGDKISKALISQAKLSCEVARKEEKDQVSRTQKGHASLIGVQTGKIVDFDIRSKTCATCNYYKSRNKLIPDHTCNINWTDNVEKHRNYILRRQNMEKTEIIRVDGDYKYFTLW